jgi:hypothetical protein
MQRRISAHLPLRGGIVPETSLLRVGRILEIEPLLKRNGTERRPSGALWIKIFSNQYNTGEKS